MDKKVEILNAVDHLFAAEGYHLSMADIAKSVGIKVPSIYSHYTGKDEIILLVIEREVNHFYDLIFEEMKHMKANNCEENLKSLYYGVINYVKQGNRLRFWRNISLIQNPDLKKACGSLVRSKESGMKEMLLNMLMEGKEKRKIDCVNPKSMVSLFFVVVKGVMDMMIVYENSDFNMQAFFDEIWNEFWHSIKT